MNSEAQPIPYSVLIVEDELAIAENLLTALEGEGLMAEIAGNATAALARLNAESCDLVILDIGLPGMDGYRLLQHMRESLRLATPVLIVSARSTLEDKLLGFNVGADDFITKPFALEELVVRVKALIRRTKNLSDKAYHLEHGPLRYLIAHQELTINGKAVQLAHKSLQILQMLMLHTGRVVTRQRLEDYLWQGEPPSSEALRSQIHLLRRGLLEHGFEGIETVHGRGWKLVAPSLLGVTE
ncbi:response regulator transcription factor [Ottowia thiooxydans]|uniref:response regulator transcription factor n=1 Tax=Ottowia thiooxydans TaxID=219182 RepID=UPI00041C6E06|nr:response regulator transcription factor [Ottowia thiooxydans]